MENQTCLLLVEDDSEIAKIVRDMLMHEGYFVTWATTGLEGWEDFQNGTYDLVMVDLMLPEMDGFSLCKNIRWESNIPLLIISARQEDDAKIAGLELGADDYVAKPFSLNELKARIASHLRRWQRYRKKEPIVEEQKTIYQGGLTVYWNQQRAEVDGAQMNLTVKEFDLLKVLAHNPERIFTKGELFEHVWNQIDQAGLHTVTVHVKALRAKLQDSAKLPTYIETIWGKGYRFIGDEL